MTSKSITFAINPFYRRQKPDSKFSHFDGTDEQLLQVVEQNFPLRRPGKREGSFIVPIPPVIGGARCYTPVVPVNKYSFLNSEVVAKSYNSTPLICASVVGRKALAGFVEVVIYERSQLVKIGEVSGDADYEIVSLTASDVEHQPLHPYEIARQVLNEGANFDSQEICQAIIYWGTHAFVKSRFVRHVNNEIAGAIRSGDLDAAYKLRRRMVPEEISDDAWHYVNALQGFMVETATLYA